MSSSSFPFTARCLSADSQELCDKYKDITSILPKIESPWPRVDLHQYKGFWVPLVFLEATLSMQENFKAQPSDIFLCGLPKTGSTWLKTLTFSIMTRDRFNGSTNPLINKTPHECVPTLENEYVTNPTVLDTECPLFTTHLPYNLLPPSILESNCKIIYLCREPKQTFVSTWHFAQTMKYGGNEEALTNVATELDTDFKKFCAGKSAYGPYWDHVSEYWKVSVDNPDKVFFFRYDDLKSDTLCYVRKLAEFMGKPFSKEEESLGVAEKIVELCHFKSLSNLDVNKSGSIKACSMLKMDNSTFFRKGETGDWKNLLTEEMANSIDHITQEKFKSLGWTFPVSAPSEDNTKGN